MQSASSVRSHRARVCAAVALLQLAASSAAEARSPDSAVQSSPSSTDGASGGDRNAEGALGPVRIGAFGGVGFPRPLSVEAMVKIDDLVGLGVEYGALPQVTVSSVTAAMNAVAVDVRVFPMRNGFFVGLAAGRQEIDATATVAVSPALGSLSGQVSAETWYLNPRIGFLWTWRSGITIGMERRGSDSGRLQRDEHDPDRPRREPDRHERREFLQQQCSADNRLAAGRIPVLKGRTVSICAAERSILRAHCRLRAPTGSPPGSSP